MPRASATLLQFSANTRWVELHTKSQLPIEVMNFQEKNTQILIYLFYVSADENSKLHGNIAVFSDAVKSFLVFPEWKHLYEGKDLCYVSIYHFLKGFC